MQTQIQEFWGEGGLKWFLALYHLTFFSWLTVSPDMSAYFFGGLRDGGASMLLSEQK